MTDVVGKWARRTSGPKAWEKKPYHLVESERGEPDRLVTKCGREMTKSSKKPMEFFEGPQERPGWTECCMQCLGG